MSAREIFAPGLRTVALAAVSAALPDSAAACTHHAWTPSMLAATVAALRAMPPPDDAALVALADHFALSDAELLAATLAAAVEEDARLCREIAAAQAPLGAARPLIGFMATALAPLGATALGLATGPAVASGMLRLGSEDAPLPERTIAFHLPTLAALHGRAAEWEDVRPADLPGMALPQQRIGEAERWARALAGGTRGLVLRCASPAEAMASSALVVERLGLGLAHTARAIPGLAAWLVAAKRCPVFTAQLAPGERWKVPDLSSYAGPWFVAAGLDGLVEADATFGEWVLPVPGPCERERLWRAAGLADADAARAAASWRQGAGRIAEIATRARVTSAVAPARQFGWRDAAAALAGGVGALDGLAQRSTARVEADALVIPRSLSAALDRLVDWVFWNAAMGWPKVSAPPSRGATAPACERCSMAARAPASRSPPIGSPGVSGCRSIASISRLSLRSGSARPKKTCPHSWARPNTRMSCCFSTKPTRCSPPAPR